jgi:IS5 family transposase
VLCAAGFNIRWLLRMIRKKGIRLYFALIKLFGLRGLMAKNLPTNHIEQLRRGQLTVLAA